MPAPVNETGFQPATRPSSSFLGSLGGMSAPSVGPSANWFAPQTSYGKTKAFANNQMAAAVRGAGRRQAAGQGLSRGAGQRSLETYRDDIARAGGQGEAAQTYATDAMGNQNLATQGRMGGLADRLNYDTASAQLQQSRWDNRFNTLTTAWGALAGLLK